MQGFDKKLFAWFRDENGRPRTSRDDNGSPPATENGSVPMQFFDYIICSTSYVAGGSTVRTVTYTDWQTRNGPVNKTVTQIVTPKVVVWDRYA